MYLTLQQAALKENGAGSRHWLIRTTVRPAVGLRRSNMATLRLKAPNYDTWQVGTTKREINGKKYYLVVHFNGNRAPDYYKYTTKAAIIKAHPWMRGKI